MSRDGRFVAALGAMKNRFCVVKLSTVTSSTVALVTPWPSLPVYLSATTSLTSFRRKQTRPGCIGGSPPAAVEVPAGGDARSCLVGRVGEAPFGVGAARSLNHGVPAQKRLWIGHATG